MVERVGRGLEGELWVSVKRLPSGRSCAQPRRLAAGKGAGGVHAPRNRRKLFCHCPAASCNKCQTGHYHVSCATELLEKRFKQATSKQVQQAGSCVGQPRGHALCVCVPNGCHKSTIFSPAQAKNAAFYLRQPHAEMARGRCPATGAAAAHSRYWPRPRRPQPLLNGLKANGLWVFFIIGER